MMETFSVQAGIDERWFGDGAPYWLEGRLDLASKTSGEARQQRRRDVKVLRRHAKADPAALTLARTMEACRPEQRCGACAECKRARQRAFVAAGARVLSRGSLKVMALSVVLAYQAVRVGHLGDPEHLVHAGGASQLWKDGGQPRSVPANGADDGPVVAVPVPGDPGSPGGPSRRLRGDEVASSAPVRNRRLSLRGRIELGEDDSRASPSRYSARLKSTPTTRPAIAVSRNMHIGETIWPRSSTTPRAWRSATRRRWTRC